VVVAVLLAVVGPVVTAGLTMANSTATTTVLPEADAAVDRLLMMGIGMPETF
jgi:hypothetical protein